MLIPGHVYLFLLKSVLIWQTQSTMNVGTFFYWDTLYIPSPPQYLCYRLYFFSESWLSKTNHACSRIVWTFVLTENNRCPILSQNWCIFLPTSNWTLDRLGLPHCGVCVQQMYTPLWVICQCQCHPEHLLEPPPRTTQITKLWVSCKWLTHLQYYRSTIRSIGHPRCRYRLWLMLSYSEVYYHLTVTWMRV